MASIKKTPSGTFQIRVANKLLPKTFWATFDTHEFADAYATQLEALLAQGIVPVSLLERDSALQETWMVARCMAEYIRNNDVPVSGSSRPDPSGRWFATFDELAEAVSLYVSRAAEKLRGQSSVCGAIHVFVQTNRFRECDLQYSNGVIIPFPDSTADTRVLACAAIFGLRKIFRDGYLYKKAGVMLMDLAPNTVHQQTLFSSAPSMQTAVKVMAAMDALNSRYGRDALHLASAGLGHRWATLAQNRTQKYTTDWNELPAVRAN
jgi:hypothetical protein